MSDKNLKEELNPSLVVIKDNKPKWYLPETRRDGYRGWSTDCWWLLWCWG